MKPTYHYLAALLFSLFFAVSCNKDDGGDEAEPDRTELITAKAWKASDITAAGISLKNNTALLDQYNIDSDVFGALINDGVITFNEDGSYTLTNTTTSSSTTGTWKLSADEKQFILNEGTSNSLTLTIVTLDADTFDGTSDQSIPGVPVPVAIGIFLIPA